MTKTKTIDRRAKFDFVRYSNCWEDPLLLLGALPEGAKCLSIASAGDNSFMLLSGGARSVTAFDLNPVQLALCELKKAAIYALSYEELIAFLGFAAMPGEWRLAAYRDKLRPIMPSYAAALCDARPGPIAAGVVDCGKFESYFRIFSRRVLPLAHSKREVAEIFTPRTPEGRADFFDKVWANLRYRLLFKLFFNRFVMGRLGRDPEFFRYVDKMVISKEIWGRAERAMKDLTTEDNPYMRYVFTGSFSPVLPDYVLPGNYGIIRERLDRIRFVKATPDELAGGEGDFDFFNLSDIFEYMGRDVFEETARTLRHLASPGAVFAYYNMLLPRDLTEAVPGLEPRAALADRLFARNRAFFYGAYHVDTLSS